MKPAPIRKVPASKVTGPSMSSSSATPIATVAAMRRTCVTTMILRRSTMSASAPAASPNSNVGKVLAVCTMATISAEGVSVAIIHAAMVACIV